MLVSECKGEGTRELYPLSACLPLPVPLQKLQAIGARCQILFLLFLLLLASSSSAHLGGDAVELSGPPVSTPHQPTRPGHGLSQGGVCFSPGFCPFLQPPSSPTCPQGPPPLVHIHRYRTYTATYLGAITQHGAGANTHFGLE